MGARNALPVVIKRKFAALPQHVFVHFEHFGPGRRHRGVKYGIDLIQIR